VLFNVPTEESHGATRKMDGATESQTRYKRLKLLSIGYRLCGLVIRILDSTDPEVPGSIPGNTRFSEK
jgi:hypothetical protein